jgi:hypothetical protein
VGAYAPESGSDHKKNMEKINWLAIGILRLKNGCICWLFVKFGAKWQFLGYPKKT